jgi:BA14K-like protein
MTRLGILGATALSLSLAMATPVLAQQARGGHPGAHGTPGAVRMGGAAMGARSNFGGAQANFQTNAGRTGFTGRGGQAQFAQRGGEFRGDRGRGFGRDAGFAAGAVAAGVATGAAIATGGYGYGYSDPYYGDNYAYDSGNYGDSYAYDNGASYDTGLPLVTFNQPGPVEGPVAVTGDASYCAQRYRSYDPASGTYLGFDGLRHPCM